MIYKKQTALMKMGAVHLKIKLEKRHNLFEILHLSYRTTALFTRYYHLHFSSLPPKNTKSRSPLRSARFC